MRTSQNNRDSIVSGKESNESEVAYVVAHSAVAMTTNNSNNKYSPSN